ncbi:MAG: trigger factor [Fibrobacter sp.]|nr:trigger factor [Fibrobacter sp.]
MKATVSAPESWKRVIEVEIPVEEVTAAFEEKLTKYKKEIKMPGFRPGKIPVALIKQRFGASIRGEAIDELVQKSFKDACEQNQVTPVAPAKVKEVKADKEDEPVSFVIETEVDPPVDIKGYEKLKVKASPKKIKDSDVEDAIKGLQERFAEFTTVERESRKGDYVKFEYVKVVIDGTERTDIQNPNYPVEIGGDSKIKDFDKGLTGRLAGETVEIDINFPNDYSEADIAGKSAQFTVKITAVQEKKLPEVNEEFMKKIGNFTDIDAFRVNVKENIEREETTRAKNEAHNEAIEKIAADNPFDVPPARVEQFIDYMYHESTRYNRPGQPVPSREEVAAHYHETAIKNIKRQRIIDFIATKENIKATQEEVDREVQRLADMYNQPFETLKQSLRQNGTTNRIRDDIKEQKTLDFLIGEYTPQA